MNALTNDYILLLQEEIENWRKSLAHLAYSYQNCEKIGIKNGYTSDEYTQYEALTARFARSSDILTQKLLRLIEILDGDTTKTSRDRINRAAKVGIITDEHSLYDIRLLRNKIAHDYEQAKFESNFTDTLNLTPALLGYEQEVVNYCEKYILT